MRFYIIYSLCFLTLIQVSCNTTNKTTPLAINIGNVKLDFYNNRDSVLKLLKQDSIYVYYEDSNYGQDKGVVMYYFDKKGSLIRYYMEILFFKNKLQGINCRIYSYIKDSDSLLYIVNNEILPNIRNNELSKYENILIDTSIHKEIDSYYSIYIRDKKIENLLK